MSEPLDELLVKLVGDAAGLVATFMAAETMAGRAGDSIGAKFSNAVAFGVAKAQLAVLAFEHALMIVKDLTVDVVKRSLEHIDAMAKLSDRLGISTEALAGLDVQTRLADVSLESVTTGIEHMKRSLDEANDPTTKAARNLARLGVTLDDLKGKKPDEQFGIMADAITRLGDTNERTRIITETYGRGANRLFAIMKDGTPGMAAARKEAEATGMSFSRFDAAKVEQANEAMKRIKMSMEGIGNQIAIQLSPLFVAVADDISEAARQTGGFKDSLKDVVYGLGVLVDSWRLIEIAFLTVAEAGAVFNSSFTLVINMLTKGFMALFQVIGNASVLVKNSLSVAFDYVGEGILKVKIVIDGVLQKVGAALANLLTTVANAMIHAGVKGGAAVQELANAVARSTGTLVADATKKLEDLKIKTKNDAQDAKFSWEHLGDVNVKTGFLDDLTDKAYNNLETVSKKLSQTFSAPLPSVAIKAWGEQIQTTVDKIARATAEKMAKLTGGGDDSQTKALEKDRQARLAVLEQYLTKEEIAEANSYAEQVADAQTLFDTLHVSQEEQNLVKQNMEQAHQAKMQEIRNTYAAGQLRAKQLTSEQEIQLTQKYLGVAANLMQSHNKTMFEIGKVAAIANAVVSTYQAAAQAMKEVPYPYNFAAAASVIAYGFVQVSNIKSTSFGGNGGGGGGSPSVPVAGANQGSGVNTSSGSGSAQSNASFTIALQGNGRYSAQDIRDLFDAIKENGGDGLVLRNVRIES